MLAIFLFVSPWVFAFAQGTLRIDAWIGAALVFAMFINLLAGFLIAYLAILDFWLIHYGSPSEKMR